MSEKDGPDSVPETGSEGRVDAAPKSAGENGGSADVGPAHQRESDHEVADPPPDQLAALACSVDGLAQQVRVHHDRAQAREQVIDQLHAEVERLRVGEQGLLLRPIIADLQRLRGDLLHQAATLSPQIDQSQAVVLLESFALSVELALERCGSVPIRPSVGAQFSAREHRAVKVVTAQCPEEDGTIATVVADGYLDTGTERITAPARVHVRRWTPPEPSHVSAPAAEAEAESSEQQESSADV